MLEKIFQVRKTVLEIGVRENFQIEKIVTKFGIRKYFPSWQNCIRNLVSKKIFQAEKIGYRICYQKKFSKLKKQFTKFDVRKNFPSRKISKIWCQKKFSK